MDDSREVEPKLFGTENSLQAVTKLHTDLLALSNVRGLGETSLQALFRAFPDLEEVWDAHPQEIQQVLTSAGLRNWKEVIDQLVNKRRTLYEAAAKDLDRFKKQGITLLTIRDADYPTQLRKIKDPPLWLFVEGDVATLSLPNLVSVVGTREASAEGVLLTRELSGWLATHGLGIVSGLAEGIDAAAHQTALDYGVPTIAVTGTGIFISFPATTSHIRQQIVSEGGAVITEYLPHTSYSRTRFIQRNRIQAGLSYATVPVEARAKSGTASTVRFAHAYGRVTFGVKRSSRPINNSILDILRLYGSPIFDMDSPDSMQELQKLLRPALENVSANELGKQFFGSVLREFHRIVDSYPVTERDVEVLRTELETIWKRARYGG